MKNIYKHSMKVFLLSALTFVLVNTKVAGQSCQANFIYTVNSNGYVQFQDTSFANGAITAYLWSFGDGTSGTGSNPAHTYSQTGSYTVCLTISTSNGCTDSSCQTINLSGCTLGGSAVWDSIQNTVTAYPTGGTPPYSYQWTNGTTTSTIYNIFSGNYCCVITDINGCVFTVCANAGVSCTASFGVSVQGYTAHFTNYSVGYTSLLWDFGDGSTSALVNPNHAYAITGTYFVCLTLYNQGNQCGSFCSYVTVSAASGNSILCGNIFNDLNANGFNDNEPPYTGSYVFVYGNGLQQTAFIDSTGHYSLNVGAGTYSIYFCAQQPYSITLPQDSGGCAMYQVTIGTNDTICGFDFGVALNSSTIEGYVFADANANGIKDGGEAGIAYQAVQIGNQWAYTDGSGKFSRYVPVGTYVVTYTPSGSYAGLPLTTPSSYSVNVTAIGTTYSSGNFGLNIPAGSVNLAVNILPHTTITPGFPAWYDVQVCNLGYNATGATVTFVYDAGLTFNSASPAQASHNTSTHTLTWNISSINPGSCSYIYVNFAAGLSYQIGDNTMEFASAYPTAGTDIDLSNNVDTIHQIVTGSWDPNNKLSIQTNNNNPTEQIISSVNSNQEIKYTVNFQNLGTAPAVNVVVIDQLSSDVNPQSFQLVGASHNAIVSRTGNTVMYRFQNIMLPEANANEPMSHGFISYTVNAVNGLSAGTQIADFANIYFDFNNPVTTNNAVVTMVNPTGINEVNSTSLFTAYPNPLNDAATIQFSLTKTSLVTLALMDATGRVIELLPLQSMNNGLQKTTLDASAISNGMYLLKLTVDGKVSQTKVLVSH
jgi:uncharacterized repeat protein (TIGR01451 family)